LILNAIVLYEGQAPCPWALKGGKEQGQSTCPADE